MPGREWAGLSIPFQKHPHAEGVLTVSDDGELSGTLVVELDGDEFHPATLSIRPGSQLVFENVSGIQQSVFSGTSSGMPAGDPAAGGGESGAQGGHRGPSVGDRTAWSRAARPRQSSMISTAPQYQRRRNGSARASRSHALGAGLILLPLLHSVNGTGGPWDEIVVFGGIGLLVVGLWVFVHLGGRKRRNAARRRRPSRRR